MDAPVRVDELFQTSDTLIAPEQVPAKRMISVDSGLLRAPGTAARGAATWQAGKTLSFRRGFKLGFDTFTAAVGLTCLAPLLALIALAVRLDSRGPVLFSQERVGLRGRRFKMFKIRTMVDGAEAQRAGLEAQNIYADPRLFKIRSDPRTTRLGYWLRKTSVDELPQLFNVLRGEMALVGPRPPLPDEVAHYSPRDWVRLQVRPGITGPWQVAGRNEITEFDTVVQLEFEYLANWTLMRDLQILLATIPVVLRTKGAH